MNAPLMLSSFAVAFAVLASLLALFMASRAQDRVNEQENVSRGTGPAGPPDPMGPTGKAGPAYEELESMVAVAVANALSPRGPNEFVDMVQQVIDADPTLVRRAHETALDDVPRGTCRCGAKLPHDAQDAANHEGWVMMPENPDTRG